MAIANLSSSPTNTPLGAGSYGSSPASDAAVSWGAIFAGAAAAAALSLILLILGVGLGLSSVSPWAQDGIGVKALTMSTIVWLTFTQIAASGLGGYIAGRLRTRWLDIRGDEVRFRDTAHGLIAWAVATLATAALLTSVIGGIVSGGAKAGAAIAGAAGGATATAVTAGASAMPALANVMGEQSGKGGNGFGLSANYMLDSLFRPSSASASMDASAQAAASGKEASGQINAAPSDAAPMNTAETKTETITESATETRMETTTETTSETVADPSATSVDPAAMAEIGRIFLHAVPEKALPAEDARYVGQLVAKQTGMSQQEAEKRVTATYQRLQTGLANAEQTARETADEARKASAYSALWIFVSLLIGAFVASLSATWGGRQRDL